MNPTDCSAACQIAERRLPHFTATLHKRVALWCWRAPLQDSLWTSGKLRWINGYCSRVSCWGLAVLLWADHADLCYYQLTTSPALRMSQSGVTPWALCLFSIWKKKGGQGGFWQGRAQGTRDQEDAVIRGVSDSVTVRFCPSPHCNCSRRHCCPLLNRNASQFISRNAENLRPTLYENMKDMWAGIW